MSEPLPEIRKRFAAVAAAFASEAGVTLGQQGKKGFGSSALQVGGKIFAMVSPIGSFVVKLPKHRVEELELIGIGEKFDPGHGRLMKEWLSLAPEATEHWLPLAREALLYVGRKA